MVISFFIAVSLNCWWVLFDSVLFFIHSADLKMLGQETKYLLSKHHSVWFTTVTVERFL